MTDAGIHPPSALEQTGSLEWYQPQSARPHGPSLNMLLEEQLHPVTFAAL